MGITRVANVTGLDHIGIPVVVVCRPNARSLSVSQGKGLDLAAAQASALMESIEAFHAERIDLPLRLASYRELCRSQPVTDPYRLPQISVSRFHEHFRLLWIEGHDLIQRRAVWLPFEMVHLDFTLPLPEGSGCFPMGSNGLASGNHREEALVHGLCEVIERDADTLWKAGGPEHEARTRLDLRSVDDPGCRGLLDVFGRAAMLVGVWEMTSDVGVPVFRATIIDRETDPNRPLFPSSGTGCHPVREVALCRALTEAAQSRLTRISSSRDDVPRADYELTRNPDLLARIRRSLVDAVPSRQFGSVPTCENDTFGQDVEWLLGRLQSVGLPSAIAVDLGKPGLGVSVVRVVVPGLEPKSGSPGYVPGPRALGRAERRAAA